jgi:teichoic acid transport system ATP-binding protein
MSSDTIISVEGVSKKFCRSLKHTMLYGMKDVARDVLGLPQYSNGLRPDEFWALDNISLEVKRGECVGLIGSNGAGKSTLLKLLNGVTLPDKGAIRVCGRTGALLELGAGFHPLLSGRENIRMSAAIIGLSETEIDEKFDKIVEFADLGDFIDAPVKHYSSGMFVRLGFAIAVHNNPDVLLVDEALAVGDALFQAKCFVKLRDLKAKGTTIIFVTHSLDLVSAHCSRALLLDKGKVVAEGQPKEVVDQFNHLLRMKGKSAAYGNPAGFDAAADLKRSSQTEWSDIFTTNPSAHRYGSRRSEIIETGIFSTEGFAVQVLERNAEYLIRVKIRHNENMPTAIVSFVIKDPKGTALCGTNTLFQNASIGYKQAGDVNIVTFRQRIRLNPGQYLLSVGSQELAPTGYVVHDLQVDHLAFQVVGQDSRHGIFDPESVVTWEELG